VGIGWQTPFADGLEVSIGMTPDEHESHPILSDKMAATHRQFSHVCDALQYYIRN
jgi:hypothetical protein